MNTGKVYISKTKRYSMEQINTPYERIELASFLLFVLMFFSGMISSFIWPLFFIPLLIIVRRSYKECFVHIDYRFRMTDAAVLLICVTESVLLCKSSYIDSSVSIVQRLLLAGVFWFFFRLYFHRRKYFQVSIWIISGLTFLLSVLTLVEYIRHRQYFVELGYTDMTLVRQYYHPLGCKSNDWIAILLCLMPFPIYGLLSNDSKKVIPLLFASLFLTSLSIVVSFSRGGYLSLFVLLALTAVFVRLYGINSIKRLLLLYCFLFVLLSLSLIPDRKSIATTISMSGTTVQNRSTEGRLKKWNESVQLARISPLTGVGTANYRVVSDNYIKDKRSTLTGRSTNTYLQILVEKGIVGTSAYLVAIILILTDCMRFIKSNPNRAPFFPSLIALMLKEFFFSSFFVDRRMPMLVAVLILFSIQQTFQDEKTSI